MRKLLRNLREASQELALHIGKWATLRDEDADVWTLERDHYRTLLRTTRDHYVSESGSSVVDVDHVLDRLGAPREEPPGQTAMRIVFMANIACLLDELTSTDADHMLPVLQSVDAQFPQNFIAQDPPIHSDEDIAIQVLELRTHHLLHSLRTAKADGSGRFNPLEILHSIFLAEHTTQDELAAMNDEEDSPKPDLRPIAGIDLTPNGNGFVRHIIGTRIIALRNQLGVDGQELNISAVERIPSFPDFSDGFRDFLLGSFDKTMRQLDHADAGIDSQIQSQLQGEALGREDSELLARVVSDLQPHGHDNGLRNHDILQQSMHQSSSYPASAPYPDFSSYHDPPVQSSHGALYAQSAAQTTTGRKRRVANGAEGAAPPSKKARGKRKQAAAPSSSAPPAGQSNNADGGSQYPLPPSSEPILDNTDLDAVSTRSRELSAANRANRKAREPQQRSPWVRNDIRQLIRAVDVYKCKWSTIAKEIIDGNIPFEIPRDQQALRDKARLLKQDFLKADAVLPPSFDLVVLGKKEKDAVKAVGKNPDRREADVGPDERPVNTEWDPNNQMPAAPAPEPEAEPTLAPVPEGDLPEQVPMPDAPMDAPLGEDAATEAAAN